MMKFKVVAFLAVAVSLLSLNSTLVHASSKPVCTAIPSQFVPAGNTVQFSLVATDPDGGALAYNVLGIPQGASFIGNTFTWTPAANQAGTYTPLLRAFNGSQYCDVPVKIFVPSDGTVTGVQVNRAPVWSGNSTSYTVAVGQPLQFYVGASDPDGDVLTYQAFPLAQGATFDAANRFFSWTPKRNQVGSYTVRFRAVDAHIFSDLVVTIGVVPVSTPVTPATSAHPVIPTVKASEISTSLTVFNERVDITSDGIVLVSWDSDVPARGSVYYGLLSQANRPSDFQYEFVSPEDSALSTHHQISLGDQFEKQRAYYFRVVATVGNSRAVSAEHSFILLGTAGVAGSATISETLGRIFFGPLLWIVIIAVLIYLFFRRKRQNSGETESDEIVIGDHEPSVE